MGANSRWDIYRLFQIQGGIYVVYFRFNVGWPEGLGWGAQGFWGAMDMGHSLRIADIHFESLGSLQVPALHLHRGGEQDGARS